MVVLLVFLTSAAIALVAMVFTLCRETARLKDEVRSMRAEDQTRHEELKGAVASATASLDESASGLGEHFDSILSSACKEFGGIDDAVAKRLADMHAVIEKTMASMREEQGRALQSAYEKASSAAAEQAAVFAQMQNDRRLVMPTLSPEEKAAELKKGVSGCTTTGPMK